ncbi:hypothetical protein AB0G44_35805, partial [Streptomyces griseus]|uniref:hypothetical protein n=1 Tax=Streptomyces griseus TaxID=1911 RepID=UPI0034040398
LLPEAEQILASLVSGVPARKAWKSPPALSSRPSGAWFLPSSGRQKKGACLRHGYENPSFYFL